MRRITKDQLKFLQDFDKGTYQEVQAVSRDLGSDVIAVDDSKLKIAFRNSFFEWLDAMDEEEPPAPDPGLDAISNPDPTPVAAPVKPAVTKATLDKTEQDAKDLKEAEARFRYWQSQGLLDTPENSLLIESWLAAQEADHYSAAGIDRCIEANRAALGWYVAPVVEYIPGTKEVRLPLGTRPSPRHSVRQLQDLDRRQKEASAAVQRRANTELAKQYR